MNDIIERIRNRPNDAPMPTEHLLDEAADLIEQLVTALTVIGAYDADAASKKLTDEQSYAGFDEPNSVRWARMTLARLMDIPAVQQRT